MSVTKLYDTVIRRHNHKPYHYDKIDECSTRIEAHNFICGDRFDLCIQWEGNTIKAIYFQGIGCAVSKASASLLTQTLESKSAEEAIRICNQFIRALNHQLEEGEKLFSDEFKSFAVVHEIPARYDCAALAWVEVEKYLRR